MAEVELLTSHSYKKSGVQGNCGGAFISRLGAAYKPESWCKNKYQELLKTKSQLRPIRTTENMAISHMLAALREAEGQPTGGAYGRAYPLEWAFADVLEAATVHCPALVGMTDTHNGAGDGHPGAFATRHFAHWWGDNGFATDIKLTEGMRYGERRVYGWWIAPNHDAIAKYIRAKKEEIFREVERWNNEPQFQGIREADRAAERAVASALERGWSEYGGNQGGDGATEREGGAERASVEAELREQAQNAVREAHRRLEERAARAVWRSIAPTAVEPRWTELDEGDEVDEDF